MGDAGCILYDADGIERDAAHHFGGGAGPHDEGVAGRARGDEGGFEAASEREHGDEDADGAGNAQDGHNGGGPARADAAEVVRDWHGVKKRREKSHQDREAQQENKNRRDSNDEAKKSLGSTVRLS